MKFVEIPWRRVESVDFASSHAVWVEDTSGTTFGSTNSKELPASWLEFGCRGSASSIAWGPIRSQIMSEELEWRELWVIAELGLFIECVFINLFGDSWMENWNLQIIILRIYDSCLNPRIHYFWKGIILSFRTEIEIKDNLLEMVVLRSDSPKNLI